jgi:hypothetical protein
MPKLTLNVDAAVVEKAKSYAKEHGTSVSAMVETYLRSVVSEGTSEKEPPILRAIRGSLRSGDAGDYRRHLEKKYLS